MSDRVHNILARVEIFALMKEIHCFADRLGVRRLNMHLQDEMNLLHAAYLGRDELDVAKKEYLADVKEEICRTKLQQTRRPKREKLH